MIDIIILICTVLVTITCITALVFTLKRAGRRVTNKIWLTALVIAVLLTIFEVSIYYLFS